MPPLPDSTIATAFSPWSSASEQKNVLSAHGLRPLRYQARFEALERSFHHAQEMTNSFTTRREALWAQQASANREFNITLFQEMREVGPVQTQVMAALRSELGLETDIQEYLQRMEENWARMDIQLRAVLDQLAES